MRGPGKNNTVYAVYKGDDFVDVGTREEIMESMGWAKRTFYFILWQTNKGMIGERELGVYRIGKDGDE